ncbi:unnamed protein product [Paramecium sonneborni]|uniref:Uncharacterized protein n=1 Tax=Paramecium sonneborni TaxID=65129 RepID=A0A8S1RD14_9CILI|nr:unnamed protein product [Paramecium sonneborni]
MTEQINIGHLIYMCIITVCYLGSIGLCRTVIFSTILKIDDVVINSVSIGIFTLMFLIGPFSLPLYQRIILKFTYKAVFFSTSFINVMSTALYIVVIEQRPKQIYLIITILIFEAIATPFLAIFYCAYNYYVRSISNSKNVGIYFGIAYSLFSMQNFIGDIYITFGNSMYQYNEYFYYPMLLISLIISILYLFIKEPNIQSNSTSTQSINLQQKLNQHIYGSYEEQQIKQDDHPTYSNQFIKIWTITKNDPLFIYIIPTIISLGIFSAFNIVFSQDMIVPHYPMQLNQELITGLTLHGIGQFLGGITFGLISDIYGYLNLLIILQIFAILTYIISVNLQYFIRIIGQTTLNSITLIFIFDFMSGLLISSSQVITFAFSASQYHLNKNVLQFCNWVYCITFYIFTILMSLTTITNFIIGLITFSSFIILYSILNFICLWFHKRSILIHQQ